MFVKNTLSANQIPIFNNFFKKTNEIHSHNTRHTSRNTVELPQPMMESYGRYSVDDDNRVEDYLSDVITHQNCLFG